MEKIKFPAMMLYPQDFLSDMNVQSMSLEQLGAYTKLLFVCWIQGELPNDDQELSDILGVKIKYFEKHLKKKLEKVFVVDEKDNSKIYNPRIKKDQNILLSKSENRSQRASENASKRWGKKKDDASRIPSALNKNANAMQTGVEKNADAMRNDAISVSVSISDSIALVEKKNTKKEKDQIEIDFDEMWKIYPKQAQEKRALKNYKSRRSKGFTKEQLFTSVKTYVESCKMKETESDYMKLCSNFFSSDNFFKDFLEGGYEFENLKNSVQNRKVEARTINEDIAEWSRMIDDGEVVIKPI